MKEEKKKNMARQGKTNHMTGKKGLQSWHNITGLKPRKKGEWKPSKETKLKMSRSKLGKSISSKGKPRYSTRGANHYNWKGGVSREYDRVRGKLEWKMWREKVFIRDDYACQKCGKTGCELHPHHLIQVKDLIGKDEGMIYEVDNGITLCKECHRKIHRKRG